MNLTDYLRNWFRENKKNPTDIHFRGEAFTASTIRKHRDRCIVMPTSSTEEVWIRNPSKYHNAWDNTTFWNSGNPTSQDMPNPRRTNFPILGYCIKTCDRKRTKKWARFDRRKRFQSCTIYSRLFGIFSVTTHNGMPRHAPLIAAYAAWKAPTRFDSSSVAFR